MSQKPFGGDILVSPSIHLRYTTKKLLTSDLTIIFPVYNEVKNIEKVKKDCQHFTESSNKDICTFCR